MTNIYSSNYQDIIELSWQDDKDKEAKKIRDRKARELRKKGFTVEIETFDYSDLARCVSYGLVAYKKVKTNV